MKHIIEWYGIFFRFWMRWPEKIRYILVGGYNTVVSYALYTMFVFGGTSPQIALFLAFIVSSINGYLTQKFYVFNTRGNYVNEYIRCLMGWGISYALNAGLLALFLKGNMNPYVSQAVALILVTINSYLILKYIAFKPSKKEKSHAIF